ncbi:MAG: antitermination protein NusG [Phenylobacterium sp.]|nr:antitermination protein NusG [Phenylobacterium sp.]
MSIHHPTVMHFGPARIISPDGSDAIPADLWPELELLMLAEPEPGELKAWERRLEDRLGVTQQHRRAINREPDSTAPPWNILCVSPRMERKVEETLRDAGLQVYVPVETYRRPRSWKNLTRPLMPGYLFAQLADDRSLDIARANHAVRRVMCQEGRPVRVDAIVIGSIILAEACGEFDQTWNAPAPLKDKSRGRRPTKSVWRKGQRVRVVGGPFAGFLAEIVKADRADRIETFVTIFGRVTPVELHEDMLEEGDG